VMVMMLVNRTATCRSCVHKMELSNGYHPNHYQLASSMIFHA
jgi:hypothetical protein